MATSGFQIEGGFNGPGEPANNWVRWERAGRVEPSGIAVDFWNRYEEHLDRAAAIGCDTFRMGVEWARVEPVEGQIDGAALDRYETILGACHERGLEPLVTLHHFTHPAWLGDDFWLSSDSPERFAEWVRLAAGRLSRQCRLWITLNELNIVGQTMYLTGIQPPGRRLAVNDMNAASDHLLTAHVLAYEILHGLDPAAVVSTNNASISVYELDRIFVDVLMARALGVGRDDIDAWISERRRTWYGEIAAPGAFERGLRRLGAACAPVGRAVSPSVLAGLLGTGAGPGAGRGGPERVRGFRRAVDAVYGSPFECTLDVVGIDYYDPVVRHHLRAPGHKTVGGRTWMPAADLWDDVVYPEGLTGYLRANAVAEPAGGSARPLWVVENGMCNRVRRGRSFERIDGWDRPRYLRENLRAVVAAIDAGLPVEAYVHWSLVDNYEWGSYQPRFGLHGVDRERATVVLDTDAMGRDAAGEYRRLITGLRAGDRSVLDER